MKTERVQKKRQRVRLTLASISLSNIVIFVILLICIRKDPTSYANLQKSTPVQIGIYIISGIMASILTIFSIIEVKKYVSNIRGTRDDSYHPHRLTHKQVIDNDLRMQIIETILAEPGIHYNLLRKKCRLQPGHFQWHIGILLDYNIIKKQKVGQYLVFFPANTEENQSLQLTLKFPLRDSIYHMILENPGIISSDIARKLRIQRNKVKYHIDKLISANYITVNHLGNRKELYPTSS